MLETSDFLKDDCLKINCTVGVVVSAIDCSRLHSIQVPESDIGSHFGMLLESEEGSDVTFNVGGEKFRAHKLVLAARSPVFETEFFNGMEEDNDEIVVTDMEPKVFKVRSMSYVKHVATSNSYQEDGYTILSNILCSYCSLFPFDQALLHFLYRDALIEDERLTASSSSSLPSVSDSLVGKLLASADKYDLPRLRLMCESALCKDISVDSVASILALADRYHAMELKSVCLKFAAENLVGKF